ncbi:hypothetical protein JKP88DRAFT_352987 [Tribonema minus]|uniref:Uncharacterized protein n=1 Tax=Tribonema minus TaxID=303371 RepID=A0A836CNF4_9STRA|nr:hypothetical protein JKP88DRAFT_352987 [Tribonema minus]
MSTETSPWPVAVAALECRWERIEGPGPISANGTRFTSASGESGWSVYSAVLPTSGKHYFAIHFPRSRCCCTAFGFVPATCARVRHSHLISSLEYPYLVSLMGAGKGPTRALFSMTSGTPGPFTAGIYLDADARMAVMINHDDSTNPRGAVRFDDLPQPLTFVLTSPKHTMDATLLRCAVPAAGVFVGERARFVKADWLNRAEGAAAAADSEEESDFEMEEDEEEDGDEEEEEEGEEEGEEEEGEEGGGAGGGDIVVAGGNAAGQT